MRPILLCILLAVGSSCFGQNGQIFCESQGVPFSPSPNNIPLRFESASFGSSDTGSFSNRRVVNSAEQTAVRLLVIVDYLNERSERLISVGHYYEDPIVANEGWRTNFRDERRFASLVNRFSLWAVGNGEAGPIQKNGGRKRITGVSELTVTRCPISALVTAVAVEYDRGEIRTFFAPGWHLDMETALPVRGWLQQATIAIPSTAGDRVLKLVVDSTGCASVSSDSGSPATWLSSAQQWLFSPSLTESRSTSQTLALAFVVHSRAGVERSWSPKTGLPDVMAVLHVYRDDDGRGLLQLGGSIIQQNDKDGCPTALQF